MSFSVCARPATFGPNQSVFAIIPSMDVSMFTNPLQLKAYETVASALPFKIDHANIEIEHAPSYVISSVKAHNYAAGVVAAMGATLEH